MGLSRDEIIEKSITDERLNVHELYVYSSLLNQDVKVHIYAYHKDKHQDIDDLMVAKVNSFIEVPVSEFPKLKQVIFDHYESTMREAGFQLPQELVTKHNHNYTDANKEFFGLYTENDTYKAATIDSVLLDDYTEGINVYFSMIFNAEWDDEHDVIIGFKNGLIDSAD